MNDKIKQLAEQATSTHTHLSPGGTFEETTRYFNKEKFAELIVKECVEQLELVRKYRYDRVQPLENQQTIIDECQYQIKQHFGVEE